MKKPITVKNWGNGDIQLFNRRNFYEIKITELHVKEDGDGDKPSFCFVSEPVLPDKLAFIGPMKKAYEMKKLTIATQISLVEMQETFKKLGYTLTRD